MDRVVCTQTPGFIDLGDRPPMMMIMVGLFFHPCPNYQFDWKAIRMYGTGNNSKRWFWPWLETQSNPWSRSDLTGKSDHRYLILNGSTQLHAFRVRIRFEIRINGNKIDKDSSDHRKRLLVHLVTVLCACAIFLAKIVPRKMVEREYFYIGAKNPASVWPINRRFYR